MSNEFYPTATVFIAHATPAITMPSPLASLTLLLLPLALDAAIPPAVFECGAANYHWEGCSSANGLCRSWQYAAPRPTVSEECVHACEGVLQLFPSPPKGPDVDIASAYPLDRIFSGYRGKERLCSKAM